jgi:hypothetical protein
MMRMTHRCDVDSLKLSRCRAGELAFCCQHCGCAHHGYSDCTLPLVALAATNSRGIKLMLQECLL